MRCPSLPADLASGYAELKRVDQALRDAQERLHDAHVAYALGTGPRPQAHYQEVISLRRRSRLLLDGLAELFLARE
ncbi:MAG: hypothetical protein NVS3B2_03500 [Ramlibacter sp.]